MTALANGRRAKLIGFTQTSAALHSSPRQPHGKAETVVVAAGAAVVFRRGLTAEFATPNDQSAIEQTSLLEILDQPRNRLVGPSCKETAVLKMFTVTIPVTLTI